MPTEVINNVVEVCFATDREKFRVQRSAHRDTLKSGKRQVISPILIKTVCACMHLQVACMHLQVTHIDKDMQILKTCLAAKEEEIADLQEKVATSDVDADQREQLSKHMIP